MGRMTDALKKASLISEAKLPPTAPERPPETNLPVEEESEPTRASEGRPADSDRPEREPSSEVSAFVGGEADAQAQQPVGPKAAGVSEVSPRGSAREGLGGYCVTALEREGVSAEEFRALKQRVLAGMGGKRPRVVLVTGAAPRAGTSLVAANLALSLGENADFRVLLMDANLSESTDSSTGSETGAASRSVLSEIFGLKDRPGLAEILLGRSSVAEAVTKTGLNNVWVMGAGRARRPRRELLAPQKFRVELPRLKQAFGYVVIDSPSVTSVVEAAELAPVADAVVLVVRRRSCSKRDAREALRLIRNRGADVLGCVMVDA